MSGIDATVTGSDQGRNFRWVPWVLLPLIFIIYASHPTRKFYFDGVVFASLIELGPFEKLYNPHHLLYTPVFYFIHNLLQSVTGYNYKALHIMQWANIIAGTLGVGLIWRLISRLTHEYGLALLVTLLGCFSFTYWHYATDADVYIISMCFLLLAADRLEFICRHRDPANSDFIYIGLMQAASVLFHQLNIFFIGCVIGCITLGALNGDKSRRWKFWWIYAASLAVPVAACYIGIGAIVLGRDTFGSFMYWITQYGHEEQYWIHSWREIPLGTLNGYLMAFFHRPSISQGILDYNLSLALEEGRFWKGAIKKIFGLYSLGFLFFCYLAALYNLKKFSAQYPKAAVFIISWLAPYVIFQFFFMPMNYFYKLFILVPLLTTFAWYGTIVITREKRWLKFGLFGILVIFVFLAEPLLGVIVAIFVIAFDIFRDNKYQLYRWGLLILVIFLPMYNYIAGIEPESMLKNNPEVVYALSLEEHFRDGDLLIFEGGYDYPDGWIISALTDARVVTCYSLYRMDEDERLEVFGDAGRVFIHPNCSSDTTQLRETAEENDIDPADMLRVINSYDWEYAFSVEDMQFKQLVIN